MIPTHSGKWEDQLRTLRLHQLRLIFRRVAPNELLVPHYLKDKDSLINGCLKLPANCPGRTALNEAIAEWGKQAMETRTQRAQAKRGLLKANKEAKVQARRLARQEVCASMFHNSLGDISMFMETPTPAEVSKHLVLSSTNKHILQVIDCMRSFHHATNMSSLQEAVCGICARRLNRREYDIQTLRLEAVPNLHRLRPTIPHPKHDLYQGVLLEPEGVDTQHSSSVMVNTCVDCRKAQESKIDRPPRQSLAGGMWIGEVPFELSSLTLPEALLIAHKYPRTFVCKLWPKDRRGANPNSLNTALRGNVTSFDLNVQSVSEMISGNLMPRPPQILASLITITFISRFPLPPSWLRGTFRVRREHVKCALEWLKDNNPYYKDINIDDSRLESLPEDGVPDELLHIVRQERDELNIARENDSYVPEYGNDDEVEAGE